MDNKNNKKEATVSDNVLRYEFPISFANMGPQKVCLGSDRNVGHFVPLGPMVYIDTPDLWVVQEDAVVPTSEERIVYSKSEI